VNISIQLILFAKFIPNHQNLTLGVGGGKMKIRGQVFQKEKCLEELVFHFLKRSPFVDIKIAFYNSTLKYTKKIHAQLSMWGKNVSHPWALPIIKHKVR
jgi:hypothetical protein